MMCWSPWEYSAILGLVVGVEVDSLFVVAILTIVGFSVNDTVVIYDRIRENIKLHPHRHINDIVDDRRQPDLIPIDQHEP
jgi:preprotein translocase subunit SecF